MAGGNSLDNTNQKDCFSFILYVCVDMYTENQDLCEEHENQIFCWDSNKMSPNTVYLMYFTVIIEYSCMSTFEEKSENIDCQYHLTCFYFSGQNKQNLHTVYVLMFILYFTNV